MKNSYLSRRGLQCRARCHKDGATKPAGRKRASARRGFTLVQLIIVIAIIAILAALILGFMGRGREQARRAQCDMNLKTIALALNAFRQENGYYPQRLAELVDKKYLTDASVLHCPGDPRAVGVYDPTSSAAAPAGYEEYYAVRGPHDGKNLPLLVCPLHEKFNHGAQAFIGQYTKQFSVRPARLEAANSVTIERPDGKGAIAAMAGTELQGGDRIRTSGSGRALIVFADQSTATLEGGTDVTVLQSFMEGHTETSFYTMVRQTLGTAVFKINKHGNKFDVVMPTATAGARGTEFRVTVKANGDAEIKLLTDSQLFISSRTQTGLARQNETVTVTQGILGGGLNLGDTVKKLLGLIF